MDQTPSSVPSETGILRLYGLSGEEGYPALVPLGTLPVGRREGAPEWEREARRRLWDLLSPRSRATDAEVRSLDSAQIPLQPKGEKRGFHIASSAERVRDTARAVAGVASARGIARLYGLSGEEGYPRLVSLRTLPVRRRAGAPEWENKARQRLNDLLRPEKKATDAEVRALNDARIPLRPRKEGPGLHIAWWVERAGDDARARAAVVSAMGIARLYGVTGEEGYPGLVPLSTFPAPVREGAPEWENKARQRMRHLLDPRSRASEAEVRALNDARIPLRPRGEGRGFHIAPPEEWVRGQGPVVPASAKTPAYSVTVARMRPGVSAGPSATPGPATAPARRLAPAFWSPGGRQPSPPAKRQPSPPAKKRKH